MKLQGLVKLGYQLISVSVWSLAVVSCLAWRGVGWAELLVVAGLCAVIIVLRSLSTNSSKVEAIKAIAGALGRVKK